MIFVQRAAPPDGEKERIAEAERIIDAAEEKGVVLRLIGGLAVRNHCVITYFCEREYLDIDFVGLTKQSREITLLLDGLGYEENRNVRLVSGGLQLQFYRENLEDHIDVFLGTLRMEHDLSLKNRLNIEDYTISVSDLLLSKLQIYEINEKDARDTLAIVKDLPLGGEDEKGVINVKYIAEICAKDWGWYKDVTTNINRYLGLMQHYNLRPEEIEIIKSKLGRIREEIEKAPKTLEWKLRARIGERKAWRRTVEDQGLSESDIDEELRKKQRPTQI